MQLAHLAMITTGIIVTIGMVLVLPEFLRFRSDAAALETPIMLVFTIPDNHKDPSTYDWCQSLGQSLEKRGMAATVFESGITAESIPECISSFSSRVDLGSSTYDYVNIVSISDYSQALEQVRAGKESIDHAGNINSKLFRAPYGKADDNIYSELSRSGILADFTYSDHYNKYEHGMFVRYPIVSIEAKSFSPSTLQTSLQSREGNIPLMILFDDSIEIGRIDAIMDDILSTQNTLHLKIVNASEITGLNLTSRLGGES